MADVAEIAKGLTREQRDWILAMPTIPTAITPEQWDAAPEDLFVQFSPDEYCPETGCYLGGGERHWFASMHAALHGSAPMSLSAQLNDLGLALRDYLANQSESV